MGDADMKKYVVYTALFGGYDVLRLPRVLDPECDYVCFSDDPHLKSDVWDVRYLSSESGAQLANRHCKFFPHVYLGEYAASVYIDSNIELLDSPVGLIRIALNSADMCCARHPLRNCSYEEVRACREDGKISGDEADLLIGKLEAAAFPPDHGLFENNVIVRNHRSEAVAALMQAWWEMFEAGPRRDQLTLPYLAWLSGTRVHALVDASTRTGGKLFRYHLHAACADLPFLRRRWLTWKARHLDTRTFRFLSAFRSAFAR